MGTPLKKRNDNAILLPYLDLVSFLKEMRPLSQTRHLPAKIKGLDPHLSNVLKLSVRFSSSTSTTFVFLLYTISLYFLLFFIS